MKKLLLSLAVAALCAQSISAMNPLVRTMARVGRTVPRTASKAAPLLQSTIASPQASRAALSSLGNKTKRGLGSIFSLLGTTIVLHKLTEEKPAQAMALYGQVDVEQTKKMSSSAKFISLERCTANSDEDWSTDRILQANAFFNEIMPLWGTLAFKAEQEKIIAAAKDPKYWKTHESMIRRLMIEAGKKDPAFVAEMSSIVMDRALTVQTKLLDDIIKQDPAALIKIQAKYMQAVEDYLKQPASLNNKLGWRVTAKQKLERYLPKEYALQLNARVKEIKKTELEKISFVANHLLYMCDEKSACHLADLVIEYNRSMDTVTAYEICKKLTDKVKEPITKSRITSLYDALGGTDEVYRYLRSK